MTRLGGWGRRIPLALALLLVPPSLAACDPARGDVTVSYTVGDVTAIHDEVTVGGVMVQGGRRIAEGQTVKTGATGRARLVLDDGSTVALDRNTSVTLSEGKLKLESGRAFVRADKKPVNAVWGEARAKVSESAIAFDLREPGRWRAYCANGELSITAGNKQHRVEGGETASWEDGKLRVLPEKAFEDWTGGLAEPERSAIEGKSAIPHLRARADKSDAGSPLIVRSHQVDTKIVGEVAVTKSRTRYFNGSDQSGEAHVRLALPPGAILTSVAVSLDKSASESQATVEVVAGPSRTPGHEIMGLEWAGGGWLQGTLGRVEAGGVVQLSLEYAEWLPIHAGQATYRYATSTDSSQGAVADLAIRVDAQESKTAALSVSRGAEVKRRQATYRAADVKPSGDFVVELKPAVVQPDQARVYVERTGAQAKDSYILVRTEMPEQKLTGVTLAVVIDTSLSVGAAHLETSLAVVDTLIESLGPKDSLVLLAADESTRSVGPETPAAVDDALRGRLRKELAQLRPGGASNLSYALQKASDLLDAYGEGEGMVIYLGDGRPSVGEPDAASIRALLSARPGGLPRIGAVAVGPAADQWLLSRLVSSSGVVAHVRDREEAARAGATLLAEALTPRLREVALDLGPHVDRIYPRQAQVVTAGSTVSVVGRLRGSAPAHVELSYRSGGKLVRTKLDAVRLTVPPSGDLGQQWASARVAQIASEGEGIEPAIALAKEYRLTTPWTSWLFSPPLESGGTKPFAARILDLSARGDVPFAAHVEPLLTAGASLIEPNSAQGRSGSLVDAAEAAMKRLMTSAARSVRACRDARAVVNPEVGGSFHIEVSVDADGVTTKVVVRSTTGGRGDRVLERCIEGVVRSLPYVGIGKSVSVSHDLTIYGSRNLRATKCSEASRVSLPVRREIWRARSPSTADDYRDASQACELRTWADRQEFLTLMMSNVAGGESRLLLAERLYLTGEADAAEFVREQTLRAVSSFDELQSLMRLLRADEPDVGADLESALSKATSHEDGLAICRKFLRLAPHNTYARRRLLSYLEVLDEGEAMVSTISGWRAEPVVDAGLLAEAASALMRLGKKDEGRRAFGELIERAPRDPWTLSFVGDRLRAEGLFDEAGAAYASLARVLPYEASVTLRQALAHAGAGRVDVATRLLTRVAQTGGRSDDGRLSDLAAITEAAILAAARGGSDPEVEAELERRLLRAPLPDAQALILVRSAPTDQPVRLEILRELGETQALSAELDARTLGLSAARVERGEQGSVKLALRRDAIAGPSHPIEATVSVLYLGPPGTLPEIHIKTVQVPADGKGLEMTLDEGRLL